MTQHEPHISQQVVGFEAINYPDTCNHLDKDSITVLGDALDIEHPDHMFVQFSCVAIEARNIAIILLLYHILELV